jgi:hypothetical protein
MAAGLVAVNIAGLMDADRGILNPQDAGCARENWEE